MLTRAIILAAGVYLFLMAAAGASTGAQERERFFRNIDRAIVCDGAGKAIPSFDDPACETIDLHKIDPQGRVIWVGANIELPGAFLAEAKPLALTMAAMSSSEIYWNGELIGVNGTPGASKAAEAPGKLEAAFFVPHHLLVAGENRLALKMASFHNLVDVRRPVHYLFLWEAKPGGEATAFYYMPALLTAAAFVLAAVYFGMLSLNNRENTGAVFIALMAFFAGAQLWAELFRVFSIYDYPLHIWRLITIALCATGLGLAICAYVTRRFRREQWRAYLGVAAIFSLAAIVAPGFDAKALVGLLMPLIVTLAAMVRPAINGAKGARVTAAVLIGFLALMFFDGQNFLDRTLYLAASGLILVFFIDQAKTMRAVKAAKEQMKIRADQLELELLRRKIAPHFLMNTLNALVEWVESDPKTGVKMIDALADEFRLLSQMSNRSFVPLADEIALCRRHLAVMSYRVDRDFSLAVYDVDESIEVPPGILHTLVENSFTHGQFADGVEFTLRQERIGERVTLVFSAPPAVAPPAVAPRADDKDHGGAGLAYVKKRLQAAFGETALFSDGPDHHGRWVSTLSFDGRGR